MAHENDVLRSYLEKRRTVPAVQLGGEAPDDAIIDAMLTIAARVPDHGKLAPWRFIVFGGDKAEEIGERLAAIWGSREPDASDDRLQLETTRFSRAPLVIGVVSQPVKQHKKIPEWEQELSAGAVCLNLIHAANAFGYRAQWLTEWFAYDDEASAFLGLNDGERFAGFLHIGMSDASPTDRGRPDISAITKRWQS